MAEGAGELVYALDRRPELERDAAGRSPARLREAVELVRDTRLRLALNVSEELALEALAYRLQALLADQASASARRSADQAGVSAASMRPSRRRSPRGAATNTATRRATAARSALTEAW